MLSYSDYVMKREQYGDVLRDAEQARLLRRSQAGARGSMAGLAGFLAAVGAGLAGVRMQVAGHFSARPMGVEPAPRRPAAAH